MIKPDFTVVWGPSISYSIPIRTAVVAGTLITVTSTRHQLSTGDAIVVVTDPGYLAFTCSTTVVVLDPNTFTFSVASPPGPFPLPKPGQGILITATFPDYSQVMSFPERLRLTVTGDVDVQRTDDNGDWQTEKSLHAADGQTELLFTAKWKEVRLKRISGSRPEVDSYDKSAELASATTTYSLPIDSPSLIPIVTPGTYDVVTVNQYGQIIAGTNSGTGVSYEYSSHASVTTTSATTIDSWSSLEFRSAKYQIQITDDTNVETTEVLLIHDGVNVFLSERGNVFSTALSMGFFDALMATNTISLVYSASTATNKTIRFIRTAITL